MKGEYLYVFDRTHAAIAAERALLGGGVAARVMPIPAVIAAGCGIGLRVAEGQRAQANVLLHAQKIASDVHCIADGFPLYLAKPALSPALGLRPSDALAIVGCGGKTALLHRLAAELRNKTVLLATTTRILPPPKSLVDAANPEHLTAGINLLHGGFDGAKLTPPTAERLAALRPAAGYTLLECDGSKGLPLKGWAAHEPVIPPWVTATVGVCTTRPVGTALSAENVHRPAIFCALTGAKPGETITLPHIAAMISHECGLFGKAVGRRYLLVNQVESDAQAAQAQELASLLPQAFKHTLSGILTGSVQQAAVTLLDGEAK